MLREMPLRRLHICSCGFGVLLDSIPVGTLYTVDWETVRGGFMYRCGGCGKTQSDVRVIDAYDKGFQRFAPLPFDLFCEAN